MCIRDRNITISQAALTDGGIYTLTVTSTAGCSASATVSVVVNPKPNVTLVPTNSLCNTANNGSIVATGTNGTPLYTFSINGGSFTSTPAASNTYNNLSPNNYTVTIKDSKGCTATASLSLIHI